MNRLTDKKGAALLITLMVVFVVGTLGGVTALRSIQEGDVTRRHLHSLQSFWLAEAGVQRALWEINSNNCRGLEDESGGLCTSCSTCLGEEKTAGGALATGDYEVTVSANGRIVTGAGDSSFARYTDGGRAIQVRLGADPLFGYAAFAQGGVMVGNNVLVDSYNSLDGLYGGSNVLENGDIGTNGGTVNVVGIENNAIVMGDITTGPGGTVLVGNNAIISGEQSHENTVTLSSVTVPEDLASLSSLGNISLSNNQAMTITAGDYKYGQISAENGTALNIDGDVRLYLTGLAAIDVENSLDINILEGGSLIIYTDGVISIRNNASINNLTQDPQALQIYSTYDGTDGVVFENNGNVYGAIYAPDTNITIENNAYVYGAVVGSQVEVANNGAIHYDENLANLNGTPSGDPQDWQEI